MYVVQISDWFAGKNDVIGRHVTGATRAPVARNPPYDVIDHVESPVPSLDWSSRVAGGNDVIGGRHVTGVTRVPAARNPPYDVIDHVETPVPRLDWSSRVAGGNDVIGRHVTGATSDVIDHVETPVPHVMGKHVTGATRDVIDHAETPIPRLDWSSSGNDVVIAAESRRRRRRRDAFSDEQVACICASLQQRRDVDRLEAFLATLARRQPGPDLARRRQVSPSSRETCADPDHHHHHVTPRSSDVADAVLSSAAQVGLVVVSSKLVISSTP